MIFRSLTLASAIAMFAVPTFAQEMNFNRIASFQVAENLPDAEETSSEIIDATADGMTLVYTDSPGNSIGFIDIADPRNPKAAGVFMPAGEPTSVSVIGNFAIAGVNTSKVTHSRPAIWWRSMFEPAQRWAAALYRASRTVWTLLLMGLS